MNSILKKNLFFIKEHVGIFKAANNFDIFDPETNELLLNCRENSLGFFTKMLRFSEYKRMTPFCLEVTTASGAKVLTVKRGVSIFLSTVEVLDENDMVVGRFKQKFYRRKKNRNPSFYSQHFCTRSCCNFQTKRCHSFIFRE